MVQPGVREDALFQLFGYGSREKLVFSQGALRRLSDLAPIYEWSVLDATMHPIEGVCAYLSGGATVQIFEDEDAVWINGSAYDDTPVSLPDFEDHPHGELLDRLHREILLCLVDGLPLPNPIVYSKPWMRDAAMMLLALQHTGNADLLRDWVLSLSDPFDRNNGEEEPDNLGQALWLAAQFSTVEHPVVQAAIRRLHQFMPEGHLVGNTDFAPHPVYQTLWLNFGLRALGMDCGYEIPQVADDYASLFWMNGLQTGDAPAMDQNYPYLTWARTHSIDANPPLNLLRDGLYLSWESRATSADYSRLGALDPEAAQAQIASPHSWHAAEAFLYLLEHT
jgi:hypothetical protein